MKIAFLLSTTFTFCAALAAETQFSAEVDYLLFQAHQDGLFRATEVFSPSSASGETLVSNETDHYIDDNKWNSGVRVSLNWVPECRPWQLSLQYSYLGNSISSKGLVGTFDPSPGVNKHFILTDYVTNVISSELPFPYTNEAEWRFLFNQLDFLIKQPFCIGQETTLTPYFGLRGLWLHQKLNMFALNSAPLETSIGDSIFHDVTLKTDFEGVGLIGGFEGHFELGAGFNLWGRFGGGLIWGEFKTTQLDSLGLAGTTLITLANDTIDHTFWGTTWNANFALGVEWNYPINDGCQWLSVNFAWENHLYTKTNNLQTFLFEQVSLDPTSPILLDRNVPRGDFSLQGFSLGVAYFF